MKYSEWNPDVHTMQDDPGVGLVYEWNKFMKGKGAASIPDIEADSDLFSWYVDHCLKQPFVPTDGQTMFKTGQMSDTGKAGWGFTFVPRKV